MSLQDVAQYVVPGLTALAGAAYGARTAGVRVEKEELRNLLDDASATLERANQQRGAAYVRFIQEGADTTPEGREALNGFRAELSEASQIRGKLVMRTAEGAAVSVHYLNALMALGRASTELGVVQLMSPSSTPHFDMHASNRKLEEAEKDFNREFAAFHEAAQSYMKPWRGPLLWTRWPKVLKR